MERELDRNRELWELFEAICGLTDSLECALFFRDLCTLTELQAMAERWQVARLVDQGIPYRRISELTGASTATITRVAHWVNHGEGGYRAMLNKLASND
ncbi:MAG TPA: YerC/YecD family TrpR-related protein [Acidobacteriota bacterium]|nr:YerC/YecD family TrpR-related protein [Acidobacteriota bacterium]